MTPRPFAGALLVSGGMWLGLLAAWSWSATLLAAGFLTFFTGAAIVGMSKDPR